MDRRSLLQQSCKISGKRLPSEYARVEYLESTGTYELSVPQYIDTLWTPTTKTKIVTKCVLYVVPSDDSRKYCSPVGAQDSSKKFFINSGLGDYNTLFWTKDSSEYSTLGLFSQTDYNILTIDAKNGRISNYNHELHQEDSMSVAFNKPPQTTIGLFCRIKGQDDLAYANCGMKLYSCQIWDDDILVRNFVPVVRLSDMKPGLYDYITGQFYVNQGTGEFLYGPYADLPDEYQQVEYIESTGEQCIDTEVSMNPTIIFKLDAQLPYINQFKKTFAGSDSSWAGVFYASSGNPSFAVSGPYGYGDFSLQMLDRFIFIYNNGHIDSTLNGAHILNSTAQKMSYIGKLTLFKAYDYDAGSMRLFSCQVFDNSILVRTFIPCYRKSDNVIGLYDLINGVFYTNQGTGTFLKGPDIN